MLQHLFREGGFCISMRKEGHLRDLRMDKIQEGEWKEHVRKAGS